MELRFIVTCNLERESGKFESKDELSEVIAEELRNADPSSIQGPNYDGTFNTDSWEVEIEEAPKPAKKPKKPKGKPVGKKLKSGQYINFSTVEGLRYLTIRNEKGEVEATLELDLSE